MLGHTILYAKGHYQRSGSIWDDLKATLKADDYTPENISDIVGIISNHLIRFILKENTEYNLRKLLEGLNPTECWKIGYYTIDHQWSKSNAPYYYPQALVHVYFSMMRYTAIKDFPQPLPQPDPKVLPLKKYE